MKIDWKNKLKVALKENEKKHNISEIGTAINCEKGLNAVNRSCDFRDISKNFIKNDVFSPKCSNCDLEMKLIENDTLWFCPLGCSKQPNDADISFINLYNAKLEKVLNDEKLYSDFETILEEQKAVLMIDGNMLESEAERIITQSKNVRQIVLGI